MSVSVKVKSNNVNREDLLRILESVEPGVASKPVLEQSDCLVVKDGRLCTFNGDLACSCPTPFGDSITGAIKAKELFDELRKLKDEFLTFKIRNNHLVGLTGKGRSFGVRLEAEVLLPLDGVGTPGKWRKLHEDFCEAVGTVESCISSEEPSSSSVVYVYIDPEYVEANDGVQLCRWTLKTGFKNSVLAKRETIRHIAKLGMREFAEGENWIHFRNTSGLVLSCCRCLEDYPDLSHVYDVQGEKVELPKSLADAAERADVFAGADGSDKLVRVELSSGLLRIRGESVAGWYDERRKSGYKGRPLSFLVAPKVLKDLVEKHTECVASEDKIKVEAGRYTFVCCLNVKEDAGAPAGGDEEDAPPRRKNKKTSQEEE